MNKLQGVMTVEVSLEEGTAPRSMRATDETWQARSGGQCYSRIMKAARAKVVHGKIVTRARFPEGAELTVVMREKHPPIELSPEDEEAMLRSLESIKAGKGTPLAQVCAILRKL
jgi:hypothetical protein